MPDIDELLKDAARGPADQLDVDALWRRGRRRRAVSRAVAAGPIAILAVAAVLVGPRAFDRADVVLVQPPSEPVASPPAVTPNSRTQQVGAAWFTVPGDWPVQRVDASSVSDVCLDQSFGGHVVYLAEGLPSSCDHAQPPTPAEQSAVYATTLDNVPQARRAVGDQSTGTYGESVYVARIDGLSWYQFPDMNLLLVIQTAEPVLARRILNSVRPAGFADVTQVRGPSQTAEEARRDGVAPEIAAAPIAERVKAQHPIRLGRGLQTRVRTREGVWVASTPAPQVGSCEAGAKVCAGEYGEVVLLNDDGTRIKRAYPLPGLPPNQLVVTDEAVYCVRQGDGGLPDSMLCRIDRETGELLVHAFRAEEFADLDPQYPQEWVVGPQRVPLIEMHLVDGQLIVGDFDGRAVVDPDTLELREVQLNN